MTKMHVHILRGCTPTPLAHYLKALGVLRVVAQQADPSVRAVWRAGAFWLFTSLNEEELVRFFLERYAPTPMLSPWNGGSGFYFREGKSGEVDAITGKKVKTGTRDQPTSATKALDGIAASVSPRLSGWRSSLATCREVLREGGLVAGPDDKDIKSRLIGTLRGSSGPGLLPWLSAATCPLEGAASYPSLLGTGGNEGNFEYSANLAEVVLDLFETGDASESQLQTALFRAVTDACGGAVPGQFAPGAMGGANGSSGFGGESCFSKWDYVLMLEGALVLRVASLRRLDSAELGNAAAPFALSSQGAGYASASPADGSSRGEQWMPLWSGPATFAEVSSLFDEGRLHGGHSPARGTLDATRALAKLGVARGVSEFIRYGYFERNGQSNLAIPVGRLEVRHHPEVRALDELDSFVRSVAFAGRKPGAPLSLSRGQRRIEQAMLAAAFPNATAATWTELVSVLGEVEHGFLATPKSTKASNLRPLPRLSPKWLELIDDGSAEVRLAIAIASQSDAELGPLRVNAVPLAPPKFFAFDTTAEGLVRDPSVVWQGRSLVTDLTGIALRRVIDGIRSGVGHFPLQGRRFASLDDVRLFLEGRVDDVRVARLVRGLLSLNWSEVPIELPPDLGEPDALHALVRLTHLPRKLRSIVPRLDATPLRLLAAGRLQEAAARLTNRLVASSLRPKIRVVAGDPAFAMRLGACVAIPIAEPDLDRLLVRLTKPFISKHQDVTA